MALRTAHGRAVEHGLPGPRVEVLPADELPAPVPAEVSVRALPRTAYTPGDARTVALASAGGRAKAGKVALAASLGLSRLDKLEGFAPYRRKAASFRRVHCAELAQLAGGTCGSGSSSMVATAALQLAASRYLYDRAVYADGTPDLNIMKEARQQGDSSRQNLLAAYEMAVRQGRANGQPRVTLDYAAITARAEQDAGG